jgi:hypothetical protein
MRRAIAGVLLLALAAASGSTRAQAAPAPGVVVLGQEAAAQADILDVRHRYRRHRGFAFGLFAPGFGFYVGPRYYRPYPYYYGYGYPYAYRRYVKRCWFSYRRGRTVCRLYRRW